MPSEYDVFICHSSNDKAFVDSLVTFFKKAEISYWIYEKQGQNALRYLEDELVGLHNSRFFINIVSPSSLNSKECDLEVHSAWDKEKPFIPILVDINLESVKTYKNGETWKAMWRDTRVLDASKGIQDLAVSIIRTINDDRIGKDFGDSGFGDGDIDSGPIHNHIIMETVNGISYSLQTSVFQIKCPGEEDIDSYFTYSVYANTSGDPSVTYFPCDTIFLVDFLYSSLEGRYIGILTNAFEQYIKRNKPENRVGFIRYGIRPEIIASLDSQEKPEKILSDLFKQSTRNRNYFETVYLSSALEEAIQLLTAGEPASGRGKRIYVLMSRKPDDDINLVIEKLKKNNIECSFIVWAILINNAYVRLECKTLYKNLSSFPNSRIIPVADGSEIIPVLKYLSELDNTIAIRDCVIKIEINDAMICDILYRSHPNERMIDIIYNHSIEVKSGSIASGEWYQFITSVIIPDYAKDEEEIGVVKISGYDASGTLIQLNLTIDNTPHTNPQQVVPLQDLYESVQWFRKLEQYLEDRNSNKEIFIGLLEIRKRVISKQGFDSSFTEAIKRAISDIQEHDSLLQLKPKDEMFFYSDPITSLYNLM